MEVAVDNNMSINDLVIFNNWRLYFKVLRLSDICNAEGSEIFQMYLNFPDNWDPEKDSASTTSMIWPCQGRPEKSYFNIWRKTIKSCFKNFSKGGFGKKLGEWYIPIGTETRWKAYIKPTTYETWMPITTGALKGFYKQTIPESARANVAIIPINSAVRIVKEIPQDCIPADVHKNNAHYIVKMCRGPRKTINRSVNNINNDYRWEENLHRNLTLRKNIDEIERSLLVERPKVCIITDGGAHEYSGTFGVVIMQQDEIIATNNGKLYSPEFYETSYRSELYAILAGLVSLRRIIGELSNIVKMEIEIYSDNKTVIKRISSRQQIKVTVNQHRAAEADIELQTTQ
jgi:ribonuclease HI